MLWVEVAFVQITASTLSLSASTARFVSVERSEHLELWVGERPAPAAAADRSARADQFSPRPVEAAADRGLGGLLEQAARARRGEEASDAEAIDPKLRQVLILLDKLFGMQGFRRTAWRLPVQEGSFAPPAGQLAQDSQPAQAGWGMIYESHQRTVESQSATLSAQAELTLADGSRLAFSLDWSQSSLRIEDSSLRLALGDARLSDPLVLDLNGDGMSFSTELAALDLNRDGTPERFARPGGGDALLVWDRNGDGRVGDGSELPGASTGQAFAELAALDHDGNGWLDAADPGFGQLRLWDGGGSLRSLAAAGVAALATASVALPYQHRDEAGGLQAVGRRGGVFLREDGTPGAALQVDLVT